jgi:competence protein ComEC
MTTPESRTSICDAGSLMSPRYATAVLSRSIWRLGKSHIDAILISHPDNDHFNGVTLLADRFSIGAVLLSPYCADPEILYSPTEPVRESWSQLLVKLESKRIPIHIIGEGDDLSAYGLPQSAILHPPKPAHLAGHLADHLAGTPVQTSANMNATSLVVRIEHRGVGIILPGDLDSRETPTFLQCEPLSTAIVMVPHHGGRSMQTARLLDWATPKTLIFSAGKLTYRPEALEQYRRQGYEVRSTFTDGAIVIDIDRRDCRFH